MAQINNIKSKIQLKEELLTQRESEIDEKIEGEFIIYTKN